MNMELNTLTTLSTPESVQLLNKHLRCFLDSINRTKTFRIDTGDVVHPAPATRDDLMTPEWSRYLPNLPKSKSPYGLVMCLPHEEDAELRQKSETRNKIWYNLLYKRDYTRTEPESFWFNVTKKHKLTKSLHDVLFTR